MLAAYGSSRRTPISVRRVQLGFLFHLTGDLMKTIKFTQPLKAALFILGLLIFVPASLRSQTDSRSGKSEVKVRAIYDDNERPVRRTEVSIHSEDVPNFSRRRITDSNGEVKFNNVPAGSFTIIIGFAGSMHGNAGFSSKGSVVVDGSTKSELTLRAKRGGALTGKITYADGELVVGARVNALTQRGKYWSRLSEPAKTDDRGIYRIYPLAEGEYKVSAYEEGQSITDLPEGGSSQTTTNYSLNPYYYGGGRGFKSAQTIHLEASREVNNIDITLAERSLYKISGTVLGAGVPLAGATLSLRIRDEGDAENPGRMFYMGTTSQADNKGVWVFADVPEGSYYLEVSSEQPIESFVSPRDRSPQRFVWQPYPIEVTNSDIANVVISAAEGGRLSGVVTVEGDKPLARGEIFLRSSGIIRPPDWRNHTALESGSKGEFTLNAIPPGDHFLLMNPWDNNYYVKSITWKNRDHFRFPFTITEGGEVKGVRIVLATDVSDAKGRLVYADSNPVVRSPILLLPVEEWRWNVTNFRFFGTDKDGRFRYKGPPGEYGVIVLSRRQEPNMTFEHFREQLRKAPRLNLKPGEQILNEIVVTPP